MTNKLFYVDSYSKQGMKASLLWDESTDAWQYSSNAPARDEQLYFRVVPTIFRGVQKISNAVLSMPFAVYKGKREIDTSQDYQNKLEWLPNPGQTFALISQSLDLTGCSYLRLAQNDANYPKELRYYSPLTIEPKYDEKAGALVGFKRSINNRTETIEPDDLVYLWLADPYVELGPPQAYPLRAAMGAAGALKSLSDFVTIYFQRGAVRPLMVFAKGMPQKEERERLESWFNRLMGGIKNAFTWRVFNAEALDVKTIGDGLSELRDVELTKQQREDVAQALGVPPSILFDEAANYATSEQDKLNFYDDTIVPRCEFIASRLNEQLFEPFGYRLDFQPETLDIYQEDEAQRSKALSQLTTAGVPLLMAMDLLGFELTDEQRAELVEEQRKKDELQEKLTENPPDQERPEEEERNEPPEALRAELTRWQKKALNAVKRKKAASVEFQSKEIPPALNGAIIGSLEGAQDAEQVKLVFNDIWQGYP